MIKVLVVDDSVVELEIVKHALEDRKIKCVTVSNPLKAIDTAKAEQPDIIILDLFMPEMSGLELCRQLRTNEDTQSIPIIFVTADETTESLVKGVHLGVVDYLHKPVTPDELVTAILAQETAAAIKSIVEPLKELTTCNLHKYAQARGSQLELIFGRNKHWISRIVQFITWSKWSHVGIVDGDNVIEAIGGKGVQLTPRKAFSKRYDESITRYIDGDIEKARSLIGRQFDSMGIWGILFRKLWQDPEKYFCSELVAVATNIFRDSDAHVVSPRDLLLVSRERSSL